MIGQTVGHYEILEKIGEGGMGVVYKARDTHLDRAVAIKVLPKEKVADPDRQRRFVQEAKAASALNHPSIVHVYDIAKEGDVHYIAMEYVDGKTLDRLIGRKGLGLNEALGYSIQAADALSRAHVAGIVHRDLKPSNIMVTADGRVKILDFGLAKLTEASDSDISNADTVTRGVDDKPITDAGMVVGTAAYMSPEQAAGKKVDSRSDIFSFGSVLYEMMTGARAFHVDTPASTLAAVITKDPKPPSQIAAGVSSDLEKIILRCLRKDSARRFHHMVDVKVELEDVKIESDSNTAAASSFARSRAWRRWWLAAAVAVPLLGIPAWLLIHARTGSLPPQSVVPLTSYPGNEQDPSFSPDGEQVAFAWDGEKQDNFDIYVKLVGSEKPLRLTTDPAPERRPAWSPDGRQIAFLRHSEKERADIYLISPLGGSERKVDSCWPSQSWSQLSWSPDGKWLAVAESPPQEPSGIFLIPVVRGEKRRMTSNRAFWDRFPAFSPNGRFLAYASDDKGYGNGDVCVLKLSADYRPMGQPRRLALQSVSATAVVWMPDGRSLVCSAATLGGAQSDLWRIRFADGARPERLGLMGASVLSLDISRNGRRLVYTQGAFDSDIWKYEAGSLTRDFIASSLADLYPSFSPDGRRIAFVSYRLEFTRIWLCDRDGSNPVPLTDSPGGRQIMPSWSPNGRWIAFSARDEGAGWSVYAIDAEGGRARRITPEGYDARLPNWSRDGRSIYFASNRSGRNEVWRVPATGGDCVQVTSNGGYMALESWDGKAIFYTKDQYWPGALFAKPLPDGPERQLIDARINREFFVVDDGIFYIDQSESNASLLFHDFVKDKSRLIAPIDSGLSYGLTVSPDEKAILFSAYKPANFDLMLIESFR